MEIVPYAEKYRSAFIALNTAWVERYFAMEQEDREILEHVDELLAQGAMIYFAVEDGAVLATCMAMPLGDGVWELCKLAAAGQYTGKGAGCAVFRACMEYAIAHGAKKLTLISNHILQPALHIYEKCGFRPVPVARTEYARADVQMEYIVPDARR